MLLNPLFALRVSLFTAAAIDWYVVAVDGDAAGGEDQVALGQATASGATTLVSGVASKKRLIRSVSLVNRGTDSETLAVEVFDGTTAFRVTPQVTLRPGEQWSYTDAVGLWQITTVNGTPRAEVGATVVNNDPFVLFKNGTAPEAAGNLYSFDKDAGTPGAWNLGTPGMSGRVCVGFTGTEAGAIPIRNAPSGSRYLTSLSVSGNVALIALVLDYLVVTSGIVVTTTTAQTVDTVALPPRDARGLSEGHGVIAALRVGTATTNAAAITNMTITYTNQDGVTGRVGTIPSFPATAVAGTIVPFFLASGDTGVRQVNTITLGTSLVAGAVGLVLYRQLAQQSMPVANGGVLIAAPQGARWYDGTCAHAAMIASGTTATNIQYQIVTEDRI